MGGGFYNYAVEKVLIYNCTFLKNVATAHGGAITVGFNPYLEIRDSKFIGNACLTGQGGALNIINYMFP